MGRESLPELRIRKVANSGIGRKRMKTDVQEMRRGALAASFESDKAAGPVVKHKLNAAQSLTLAALCRYQENHAWMYRALSTNIDSGGFPWNWA
jgi:hypothetical protein